MKIVKNCTYSVGLLEFSEKEEAKLFVLCCQYREVVTYDDGICKWVDNHLFSEEGRSVIDNLFIARAKAISIDVGRAFLDFLEMRGEDELNDFFYKRKNQAIYKFASSQILLKRYERSKESRND